LSPWASIARQLADWYRAEARDLPWRSTRDPYAIWVSEVMLQQTRVTTVLEAWARFLERFPSPADLAQASDDALLSAWQGLGYYRRARQLRAAMQQLVARHDGEVPRDADALAALPGIGPYTKGALLSIVHDLPVPAIDGNVERVLARVSGYDQDPKTRTAHARFADGIAEMHQEDSPRVLNQALMELGALVCTPKSPRCDSCPIQAECIALAEHRVEELPLKKPRPRPTELVVELLLVERDGTVLSRRVPEGEANQGQVCLPGPGLPQPRHPDLASALEREHGLIASELGPVVGRFRHGITRYRIEVCVRGAEPGLLPGLPGRGLEWRGISDASVPWSTVARKAFRVVGLL
jgi:A/G-specific adenine glycosylase